MASSIGSRGPGPVVGNCRYLIGDSFLSPSEPAAHGKARMTSLLLLLFARRSDGSASAYAPVDVLLFLFGWFQDLSRKKDHVSSLEHRDREICAYLE
jgi:hypothetical protein